VYIRSLFIARAKPAKLTQPCKCAFHNPAPAPQPATMPCVAHCEEGADSATDHFRVIGPVSRPQSLIPKLTVAKTREKRRTAEIASSHLNRIPHLKWGTFRLSPDFCPQISSPDFPQISPDFPDFCPHISRTTKPERNGPPVRVFRSAKGSGAYQYRHKRGTLRTTGYRHPCQRP
jgi:hypothetical protein